MAQVNNLPLVIQCKFADCKRSGTVRIGWIGIVWIQNAVVVIIRIGIVANAVKIVIRPFARVERENILGVVELIAVRVGQGRMGALFVFFQGGQAIRIPVRVTAMALAGPTLFAAGTPDLLDPADPWGAIAGRKGGLLWALSASNGKKLAERKLAAPPVLDGLAAANGRLYIATKAGRLLCLGAR